MRSTPFRSCWPEQGDNLRGSLAKARAARGAAPTAGGMVTRIDFLGRWGLNWSSLLPRGKKPSLKNQPPHAKKLTLRKFMPSYGKKWPRRGKSAGNGQKTGSNTKTKFPCSCEKKGTPKKKNRG